jgi:hypothetical protein
MIYFLIICPLIVLLLVIVLLSVLSFSTMGHLNVFVLYDHSVDYSLYSLSSLLLPRGQYLCLSVKARMCWEY